MACCATGCVEFLSLDNTERCVVNGFIINNA